MENYFGKSRFKASNEITIHEKKIKPFHFSREKNYAIHESRKYRLTSSVLGFSLQQHNVMHEDLFYGNNSVVVFIFLSLQNFSVEEKRPKGEKMKKVY